jgi:hypothetical protein
MTGKYLAGWTCGLAILLAAASCERSKPRRRSPAVSRHALVRYENARLGFALLVPNTAHPAESGERVAFRAPGFPRFAVRLEHTTDATARGSVGSVRQGHVTQKVLAPLRRLVCDCPDAGQHEDLMRRICRSLENTREAPKHPHVEFGEITVVGPLGDRPTFVRALRGQQGAIERCWRHAVTHDPHFPAGHMNFLVVYGADGRPHKRDMTQTFNYPHHAPLTDCVSRLFFAIVPGLAAPGPRPRPRVVRPRPRPRPRRPRADRDGPTVEVQWSLRFKLY